MSDCTEEDPRYSWATWVLCSRNLEWNTQAAGSLFHMLLDSAIQSGLKWSFLAWWTEDRRNQVQGKKAESEPCRETCHELTCCHVLLLDSGKFLPSLLCFKEVCVNELLLAENNTLWLGLAGGPLAKTPSSQCRGPGFHPWSGTRSHMLQLKISHATKEIEDPASCN